MPEIKIPKPEPRPADPIIEEENEEDMENYDKSSHLRQRSRSSRKSGGNTGSRSGDVVMEQEDDDGLRPPSSPPLTGMRERAPPPPPSIQEGETWSFFFPDAENIPGPSLSEIDHDGVEIERKAFEERPIRVENGFGDGEREKRSVKEHIHVEEKTAELPVAPEPTRIVKKPKQGTGAGSVEGRRTGKTPRNLLEIFAALDDNFLKASESAHEVSKMLEATRLHYHSNFADNRGHIDHSARVMRVITWNRSFRGIPNVEDVKDDFDLDEHETHATVLDKLLAWEKKLYDEVKAGELMKFEYQKKVALLNKKKKHSGHSESLEKIKAAVSHLHTRYIVDMQSMDSTVSEINRLRDHQLYPKLVALVDGMATMWEIMQEHHAGQSKIVMDLRYLDLSQSPKETSEHHHARTIELWVVIQEWHSQFEKLVSNQKNYIKALNNWLKLNLIPIESNLKEKVSSPLRVQKPPIQSLLHAWHDSLNKLPDELARTAIYNFAGVINTIMIQQEEEMKLKEKCEGTQMELSKRTRAFEDWHRKFMEKKTPEDMDPEDNTQKEIVAEKKFVLDVLKKRLEEEEETYQKHCLHVREKSLASLKMRLPEIFRAMSDFSLACADMYTNLKSISQSRNPNENSS